MRNPNRVAITHFYGLFERSRRACEDDGLNWREISPNSSLSSLSESSESGLTTFAGVDKFACDALREAGLVEGDVWKVDPARVAVICGTSKGRPSNIADWAREHPFGARTQPPAFGDEIYNWGPEWAARNMARANRISGPWFSASAACASGAHALTLAARWIEWGRADVVLAGAVEFDLPDILLAAYKNMGALSKSGIMRPFDRRHDGFTPREGGAYFVLESEVQARKRGAAIHGFLTGTSLRCDAHHMTSMHPSGDGITRAIREALSKAGNPQIDYINAHGTATKNDAIEARAIHEVFGDAVPLSSTKALTGHLLGAAGAVEAAICLLAMREGFAPPTLNLHQPDGEFDLDYLPLHGRKMKIGATLSLNYGFGGHIGALVLEKY